MLSKTFANLIDLILPVDCAGCGRSGSRICPACRRELKQQPQTRILTDSGGPLEIWAGTGYQGIARDLVLEFKRGGNAGLGAVLADLAATVIALWSWSTPEPQRLRVVPLHAGWETRRAADCDVPVALATGACRILRRRGISVQLWNGLVRGRGGGAQKKLDANSRFTNAHRSLTVAKQPDPRLFYLLFDDVVTTGASMLAARSTLAAAGATVLGGTCLCSVGGLTRIHR